MFSFRYRVVDLSLANIRLGVRIRRRPGASELANTALPAKTAVFSL